MDEKDGVTPPDQSASALRSIDRCGTVATQIPRACVGCPAHDLNICEATVASRRSAAVPQTVHATAARRIAFSEQDLVGGFPIICEGWACCAVMLSDGSRQILSFLLPGDPVSTALLFGPKPNCFVETITPVAYRMFERAALRDHVFGSHDTIDRIGWVRLEEQARSDSLAVDLGRRSADERIARLILALMQRLERRGMVEGNPAEFEFPLRQHHIADATGLTPVHVSKVLSDFRRRGLIALNARTMTVCDHAGITRIAQMR
jgi:CRP-like cAMP-binding protein